MRMIGEVIEQHVAKGSKSEHPAIVLRTESATYILRRKDANPFEPDAQLRRLVGKRLVVEGVVAGPTLVVESWEEERPSSGH